MGENLPATKDTFRSLLENPRMLEQMRAVLPKHLTPERMVKLALVAAMKTPKLRECTAESIANCLMAASETGLEPGGSLGQCYIIPYGKSATFLIGYRGMIALARRSGEILSIEAHVVYKGDRFKCEFGAEPKLEHEPEWEADRADKDIKGAYAVAKLRDGGTQIEVMTRPEIDAIRKRSRASSDGPWVTDYSEMCRKTAVRRLFKYLPVSVEIAEAVSREDELGPPIDTDVLAPSASDALTPGRHPLPKKGAAKPEAPDAETGKKMEAAEKDVHEKALRCFEAIDKGISDDLIKPSQFEEACKALAVDSEKWTSATDAQIVALALKLKVEVE